MEILLPVVILVFSAILHEVMHGFVADKLGDPTARLLGRLTLNPLPHIDPINSIVVPLLFIISGSPFVFGAAKPVPVNPLHFKDEKKDMALVALAGPLTNLMIAIAASFLLRLLLSNLFLDQFLSLVVIYNLGLTIINLLPIPPLDGSKVFAVLLPNDIARSYLSIGQFGIFILLILLFIPIGGFNLSALIGKLIFFALQLLGVTTLAY